MKKYIIDKYISVKHHLIINKIFFRKPIFESKIFCIGYNKTGTTSLGKSLELLGYKNSSFNRIVWRDYYKNNKVNKILNYTAKFDSFDDLPWLKEDMIPILDKTFPNSKFIYLEREEESWKNSMYNWTYKKTDMYPDIDEKLEAYRNHKRFVLNYFKNKPKENFIVLNIKDKEGFKKLANFLGKEVDRNTFPHFNKT